MRTRSLGVLGLGLLAQTVWAADICEPLREQVEVQIAATGTTGFAVIVVEADADVAGKVVGTCAMGARKLVYVRATGAMASPKIIRPAAAAPVARGKSVNIITECRDGRVVRGNATCKP